MTALLLNPFPMFYDQLGQPLDQGYIYVGEANKDPRQFPINVYLDAAKTNLAIQPLRTTNGTISNGYKPIPVFTDLENYSVLVLDKYGKQVFYDKSSVTSNFGVTDALDYIQQVTDNAELTAQQKLDALQALYNSADATTQAEISNLQQSIQIAAAAGAGANGWTDLLVALPNARTQRDKNNDTITAKDHGAVCNGVAHTVEQLYTAGAMYYRGYANLAAVQANYPQVTSKDDTIDWAATAKAAAIAEVNGATLFLGAGKYVYNRPLNVSTNVDGLGATIYTLGSSNFEVFTIISANDITIANLKFYKLGASIKRGWAIAVKGKSDNISIVNVTSDGYNSCVFADGDNGLITNAKFRISVSNTATGGTWRIGFYPPNAIGDIKFTGPLAHNITAADFQAALDAVFGTGNIIATGGAAPATAFNLEFTGAFAGLYVQPPVMAFNLTGVVSYGGEALMLQDGGCTMVTNLTLDRVTARNSGAFGFEINNARGISLINSTAVTSWFDGIKLRKNVHDVQILGGDYSRNGLAWFVTGANQQTGDGLDCYAGGERIKIVGAKFNENNGAGIQIKNDDSSDLSGFGYGKFGLSRKIELIGVDACFNRVNNGLAITTNKAVNKSYAVSDVTVIGGNYEGNGVAGISANGFRITLNGVRTPRNAYVGITIPYGANQVEINNCVSVANGRGDGVGLGLQIAGKNVTVNGGFYCGVDTDAATPDTDLSTLTKHHVSNIRIESTAADVFINMPDESYNAAGRGIVVQPQNGVYPPNIKIWQRPTEAGLIAGQSLIAGSAGSLLAKRDGTQAGDQLFLKMTGDSGSVGTWRRLGAASLVEYSAAATMTGNHEIVLCRANTADITVTLPAVLNQIGMEYTLNKASSNAAYKVFIAPSGSDLINGNAAALTLNDYLDSVTVVGTSTGWRVLRKSGNVPAT